MNNVIKNRSEILFLYDVKDANPNGDPVDENKPRIDEQRGINIVTDVRLKRTIRDYLYEVKGLEVFIREIKKDDGTLKTKEERLDDFKDESIIDRCIDIRLFGSTTAVENRSITLTGPVQFKFGRSLHRVDLTYLKGTTVMPSKSDRRQGTFTERYILPYSLIVFYGIVNENMAKIQEIPLTEEDLNLMFEGIWNGTKNLISGSKFGQMPRLLLQIVFKEGENFYIGELDKLISLRSELPDEAIRDISEVKIDITELVNAIGKHKEKIEKIRYKLDDRISFILNEQLTEFDKALEYFKKEEFSF